MGMTAVDTTRKAAHYRRRIAERYPDIDLTNLRLILNEGQYNDIVIVGERLVFRFPRFQEGVARLPAGVRLLRAVRRHVAVATPDPIHIGFDRLEVGQAFLGYPMIPGRSLERERLAAITDEVARRRLAERLAAFLTQLHSVPLEEAAPGGAATFDPRAPWAVLYARIQARLFSFMRPDTRREVAAHFETFLADPRLAAIQPVLVHGDFGPGNVLAAGETSEALHITGVIDFDHSGPGDLAIDLAAAESFELPQLAAASPESEALIDRARFYRGTFVLQEALYGIEHGDDEAFTRAIAPYR